MGRHRRHRDAVLGDQEGEHGEDGGPAHQDERQGRRDHRGRRVLGDAALEPEGRHQRDDRRDHEARPVADPGS